MLFSTGIAVYQENDADFIISAATWYTEVSPAFSTRNITLTRAKNQLLALVFTRNTDAPTTVNAACNRTLETLLVQRKIKSLDRPPVTLLTLPALYRKDYVLPCKKVRNHWLITAADNALFDYMRGVR